MRGAYYPLCSCRGPVLAELGHPDVAAEDICTSVCIGIRGTLWSRRGAVDARRFRVCAPCLANWCGGGLSRFSVLLGGWCFACGAGEGCCLLAFCEIVSLVCAEGSVPSAATSGCPKRSEGGCPCRSKDVHRPSSGQRSGVWACESPPQLTEPQRANHTKSLYYRTGQIRVTNSRKSSTSLPCSSRPTPKRVATSALSSNDK